MQGYEVADTTVTGVGGRRAEELTDLAIAWIDAQPRERPLHLLVNYFDPHSPWEPPPGFDDLPGVRIPLDPASSEIFVNGGRRLSPRQRTAAIDRYDRDLAAFVQWPWKRIAADTGPSETYRLDTDPGETRDRSDAEDAGDFGRALSEAMDLLDRRKGGTPPTGVSPELRENLRELGYIE